MLYLNCPPISATSFVPMPVSPVWLERNNKEPALSFLLHQLGLLQFVNAVAGINSHQQQGIVNMEHVWLADLYLPPQ